MSENEDLISKTYKDIEDSGDLLMEIVEITSNGRYAIVRPVGQDRTWWRSVPVLKMIIAEDDQPASERLSACHVLRLCHLKGMGSDGRYHGTMEQCMIADDVERSWRKGKKYNRIDSRASVPMNFRGLVQEGSRAL